MASNIQPRIVKLYPMRVASVRAVGKEPEIEAFRLMANWARELGVLKAEGTRFFGFDNPAPSGYGGDYGYEVWMTVGEEIEASGKVVIRDFPGGTYAVRQTNLMNLGQAWRELIAWRENSRYVEGTHQCLEEHHVLPLGILPEAVEIDLYLPVTD